MVNLLAVAKTTFITFPNGRSSGGQKNFEDRDCTRKISKGAMEKPALDRLLQSELEVSLDWQRDHLVTELMEPRPLQEVQGHGASFPGLTTRFSFIVAWIQVGDIR